MADPTIQTFCCHHGNRTDMAVIIMEEFNTDVYNTVCLFSACLGLLGAIYQILPRQQYVSNHRWISSTAARGRRIIVWLAIADLMASLGVFARSALWINFQNIMPDVEDDSSVLFCAISSAWIQYFYTATWIWTLCYAIDMRMILSDKQSKTLCYHVAAWCVPAVLTTIGLSLLYIPDAKCHQSKSLATAIYRLLPNYIATYVPIALVMVANPYLYKWSTKDLERVITTVSGQFTSREREIMDAIKIKFGLINLVFYVCWVPNIINGLLLWTLWYHLPVTFIISVWYIMAFVNPLQALFNCIVYRRWHSSSERVIMPWNNWSMRIPSHLDFKSRSSSREESVPLLENIPRSSINGYTEYSRRTPSASHRVYN